MGREEIGEATSAVFKIFSSELTKKRGVLIV